MTPAVEFRKPSRLFGSRSLRFRLTLSYVFLFTILLISLGLVFRTLLDGILEQQAVNIINEEWSIVRGFLRVEKGVPFWAYDKDDPEEATIVNRIRGGLYLLADSSGKTLEVSEVWRDLIGLSPAEIRRRVQSNASGFETRHDQDGVNYLLRHGPFLDERKRYYIVIGRSLADDEKVLSQFTRYFLFLGPAAVAVICLLGWIAAGRAIRPVTDVANAAQAITGQNLTLRLPLRGAGDELDHLIERFNAMMARLEQSFSQVRQFSTDVSHELRTPLTIIRGHLEVAMMTARTPEQYQDAIHTALQDVERLTHIVRALLQLSQAESGQLVLNKAPLDLTPILQELCEQFSLAAEDKQITLATHLAPRVEATVDRVQIERLVTNLLTNAIKYTPAGGRVEVSLQESNGQVELKVADNGQGIPAEHLPHIFDRFFRVPEARANPEKGLGLGLSFVAWIVKAHGGLIDVQSQPGKGATFTVTLPAGLNRAAALDSIDATVS